MRASELLERYKNGERNFRGVDLYNADLECADLECANLYNANLYNANLRYVNLKGANLYNANLYNANLRYVNLKGANLYNADLEGANLQGANLQGVNLRYANLQGVNLRYANLQGVNLRYANLQGARLYGANLQGAHLYGANLIRVDLYNANLKNTILDPNNKITPMSDNEIVENGFTLDGDFVYGYRTKTSIHCSNTIYEPGEIYTASYFSTCTKTSCHPGIYIAPLDWLKLRYPNEKLVYVCCKKQDLLKVGDKFRAKRIMVLENYDPNKVEK